MTENARVAVTHCHRFLVLMIYAASANGKTTRFKTTIPIMTAALTILALTRLNKPSRKGDHLNRSYKRLSNAETTQSAAAALQDDELETPVSVREPALV